MKYYRLKLDCDMLDGCVDDWQVTSERADGTLRIDSVKLDTWMIVSPSDLLEVVDLAAALAKVPARPAARDTDPDSAHDAARGVEARLTADMLLALRAHCDAGPRGLIGDELAAATGRTYEQIGPRRKPLERAGLVVKVERRPRTVGNPPSKVWAYRATTAGREVLARELGA